MNEPMFIIHLSTHWGAQRAEIIPIEPEVATPAPAKPVEPSLDYNRISYQGQLMTDYKVGRVLGEIKCGKRPVQEGMNLLNVNGVPAALLQNQTPEMQRGFNAAAFGWGCV